jgi:hypothetical protein
LGNAVCGETLFFVDGRRGCGGGGHYQDEEVRRVRDVDDVNVGIGRDERLQIQIAKGPGHGQHAHDTAIGRHKAAQVADAFLFVVAQKERAVSTMKASIK